MKPDQGSEKNCGHPACSCAAGPDGYCSPACAAQGAAGNAGACACGHPGCAGAGALSKTGS